MAQYWVRGYSTSIFSWPPKASHAHIKINDVTKVGQSNPHVFAVM